MGSIAVVGFDGSMSNFGIAKAAIDVDTLAITIEELILVETSPDKTKQMVKSSDDLRRARQCAVGMVRSCKGRSLAFAELPYAHAQMHTSGVLSTGITLGVLSCCPIPIIGVQPADVKLAALGSRVGSKEEMIAWATDLYPSAPWLQGRVRGKMQMVAKNEHLADAVATIHAGIHTEQFKQVLEVTRAMQKAA
jgi:hypothetical protein